VDRFGADSRNPAGPRPRTRARARRALLGPAAGPGTRRRRPAAGDGRRTPSSPPLAGSGRCSGRAGTGPVLLVGHSPSYQ